MKYVEKIQQIANQKEPRVPGEKESDKQFLLRALNVMSELCIEARTVGHLKGDPQKWVLTDFERAMAKVEPR